MSRRNLVWLGLAVLLIVGIVFIWQSLSPKPAADKKTSLVGEQYELPNLGFTQVEGDYTWDFPADFAPHPTYQREEWNIISEGRCVYDLSISLRSLNILPDNLAIERDTEWAFDQVVTAELRMAEGDQVLFEDVLDSRAAQGLAGTDSERVWVENWEFDVSNQIFKITGSTTQAELNLVMSNPEPQPASAEWYTYQQTGTLNGSITVDDQTYQLDCNGQFTHRFGTAQ